MPFSWIWREKVESEKLIVKSENNNKWCGSCRAILFLDCYSYLAVSKNIFNYCKVTSMNQHQDYDKIFKENIEKIGISILNKICGITVENIENITATLPKTIERRADFIKIGVEKLTNEKTIYHIEFQSNVHLKMGKRKLLYYALLHDKYELPIRQFVIYLGEGNWTAPTVIKHSHLEFRYEVICINSIDYQLFIQSDKPEEIILAILADFKKEDKSTVIKNIIESLHNKTKNTQKFQKFILQLEILSNLRNLQTQIVKQISAMPITFDIKKDIRYQQGIEEGIEQGIEEGKEKGIEIGVEKHVNQSIKQAHKKSISAEQIAYFLDLPLKEVLKRMKEMDLK